MICYQVSIKSIQSPRVWTIGFLNLKSYRQLFIKFGSNSYQIRTKLDKQLPVTFQVLKIFQFDPQYFVMKSNKDENGPLKIKIEAKMKKIKAICCIIFLH